jgi:membrane protein
MNRKEFVTIIIAALRKWQQNNATLRAAALSFFIILPLPSLLLIAADIYSQFLGQAQATQLLIQQIGALLGPTIGSLIGDLLQGATNPFTSVFNSFFSVVFAVAGAIGAFAVLQDTINVLWDVELPKGRSIKTRIRERFFPFVSVLGATFILVGLIEFASLIFVTVNDAFGRSIGLFAASAFLFSIQFLILFGSAVLLFAIIFKEIPDTAVEWRDVWLGAVITAVIFTITNTLFRFYLQTFPVTSLAGASGSLIILFLWVFIVAEISLYGAQFTHCYAETVGSHSEKGRNHEHPWKRLRLDEAIYEKTFPEYLREEIEGLMSRKHEENEELSTKTEIVENEPEKHKKKKAPAAEHDKQLGPSSEAEKE